MNIYSSALADIEYNSGANYGMGIWHGKALDEEYPKIMNKIAELIETNNLTGWLGNMTHLEFIKPELQKWTNEEWFPRVLNAGLKNIAVVISETALARMSVNQIMVKVGESTTKNFSSLDEAKKWIEEI